VGRSGTIITIDQAMDRMKQSHNVDLLELIGELRQCRHNMVQQVAQHVVPSPFNHVVPSPFNRHSCGDQVRCVLFFWRALLRGCGRGPFSHL
jgi:hypothetical protein